MKNWLVLSAAVLLGFNTRAQLADGSTAPDFTLTDINGTTHHLYDYLDAGKTVIIDFFAAHCPTCWAYHNTHALRDFYTAHGPSGTLSQDAVVLAIEYDAGNGHNELHGISGITQGNWVSGTPYPIINPEGANRTDILNAYNVVFYPMVYRICPDKKLHYVGTPSNEDLELYLDYCATTGMPEAPGEAEKIYLDFSLQRLHFRNLDPQAQYQVDIYDMAGRPVMQINPAQSDIQSVRDLPEGAYIFNLSKNGMVCTQGKFVLY